MAGAVDGGVAASHGWRRRLAVLGLWFGGSGLVFITVGLRRMAVGGVRPAEEAGRWAACPMDGKGQRRGHTPWAPFGAWIVYRDTSVNSVSYFT